MVDALTPKKQGILDQTLGDVLQNNPQAQQMIMKTMGITPEKFQEMLQSTQQNNLMHLKIRELFTNGIVQQAVKQQKVSQQQVQQISTEQPQQKTSFFNKIRGWFK